MEQYETRGINDIVYTIRDEEVWECKIIKVIICQGGDTGIEVAYDTEGKCPAENKYCNITLEEKYENIYDNEKEAIEDYLENVGHKLIRGIKNDYACKVELTNEVPF